MSEKRRSIWPILFLLGIELSGKKQEKLVAYHGTRAPIHELKTIGIKFPTKEYFFNMIKKVINHAGLDYAKWLEKDTRRTKKGELSTHWEIQASYRSKSGIWVADNEQTAKNYAIRNPELVWSAVRHAYLDQKRLDFKKAEIFARQAMDILGTPKVAIIDAKKIGLSEPIGINCPTGLRLIPASAIIDIKEV